MAWAFDKCVQVRNSKGKWAIFSHFLEPQTDFVLDYPIGVDRFGDVYFEKEWGSPMKSMTLNKFYQLYGIDNKIEGH